MVPQSRRRLLQIGAGLLTGLSGCSRFQEEPPAHSRLLELLALNYTTSEQSLHVLIEEREAFVYHELHRLESGDSTNPAIRRFEGLPQEFGEFVITAWIDDRLQSSSSRLSVSEFGVDCMNLRVAIENTDDDGAKPDVTVAFTSADCPADTTVGKQTNDL